MRHYIHSYKIGRGAFFHLTMMSFKRWRKKSIITKSYIIYESQKWLLMNYRLNMNLFGRFSWRYFLPVLEIHYHFLVLSGRTKTWIFKINIFHKIPLVNPNPVIRSQSGSSSRMSSCRSISMYFALNSCVLFCLERVFSRF